MIYNICMQLHGSHLATAVMVTMAFLVISIVKEKRDERKRA